MQKRAFLKTVSGILRRPFGRYYFLKVAMSNSTNVAGVIEALHNIFFFLYDSIKNLALPKIYLNSEK